MKALALLTPVIALTAATGSLYADHHEQSEKASGAVAAEKDIVTIASEAEDFSTLVAAIKAAGLAEDLGGEGPFTVFAPTNAAFEALPQGLLIQLMEPEQKERLAGILRYHVIPGKLMAENIAPEKVATLEGREAVFTVDGETVMMDGAKIIKQDIEATNGVIHVIDRVLIPPVVVVEEE